MYVRTQAAFSNAGRTPAMFFTLKLGTSYYHLLREGAGTERSPEKVQLIMNGLIVQGILYILLALALARYALKLSAASLMLKLFSAIGAITLCCAAGFDFAAAPPPAILWRVAVPVLLLLFVLSIIRKESAY